MSNFSKDHPSIRVHAPPGGHSNNIFGTDPEETHTKLETIAGQYKQAQMKSSIFETDEPTPIRQISNKNKSNIFGINDDNEQNKGVRQGLRDPNASRMGYNPINGELYSKKDDENDKQSNENVNVQHIHTCVRVFQPPGGKSNGPLW